MKYNLQRRRNIELLLLHQEKYCSLKQFKLDNFSGNKKFDQFSVVRNTFRALFDLPNYFHNSPYIIDKWKDPFADTHLTLNRSNVYSIYILSDYDKENMKDTISLSPPKPVCS